MSVIKKLTIIGVIGLASSISLAASANIKPLFGGGNSSQAPISADLGFVKLNHLPVGTSAINPIRLSAIEQTATTLGARGGLAWRSLQIDRTLQNESNYLNQVFNFNRLLIGKNVLPPVITQADNSFNLANADAIRTSAKIYKIVSPAHFVTTVPNWHSYLWMGYKKPTVPDHALLPTTQAEANVWNAYLKKGWKEGLQQANEIFAVNLARLKRDYIGMVLYRRLLAEHMISSPFVARANLGVTGNSKEIRINDRVARITDQSKLQTNPNKWTPVITE